MRHTPHEGNVPPIRRKHTGKRQRRCGVGRRQSPRRAARHVGHAHAAAHDMRNHVPIRAPRERRGDPRWIARNLAQRTASRSDKPKLYRPGLVHHQKCDLRAVRRCPQPVTRRRGHTAKFTPFSKRETPLTDACRWRGPTRRRSLERSRTPAREVRGQLGEKDLGVLATIARGHVTQKRELPATIGRHPAHPALFERTADFIRARLWPVHRARDNDRKKIAVVIARVAAHHADTARGWRGHGHGNIALIEIAIAPSPVAAPKRASTSSS